MAKSHKVKTVVSGLLQTTAVVALVLVPLTAIQSLIEGSWTPLLVGVAVAAATPIFVLYITFAWSLVEWARKRWARRGAQDRGRS